MHTRTTALLLVLMTGSVGFAADLIVGALDPNEVLEITADQFVGGDLIVLQNATVRVTGATLSVSGYIYLLGGATFAVDGATLHFPQTYSYQSAIAAFDRSSLLMTDSVIHANGHAYAISLAHDATADYTRVEVEDGFCTWDFNDRASLDMQDCGHGGEFLAMGANDIAIVNTDTVLYWVTMPAGSVLDVALPEPGTVATWSLGPGDDPNGALAYSTELTNCTNVMWGVMARSGATGTFHDAELRVVGALFDRDNEIRIRSLANGAVLANRHFAWGDVDLTFNNCTVQAWNFYCYGHTRLTLSKCVFGELLAHGHGHARIEDSMCDGAGGHIKAEGASVIEMARSTNLAQTICREDAWMIVAHGALLHPAIQVQQQAGMVLLNTELSASPVVRDAAAVFAAELNTFAAPAGPIAEIRGTAQLWEGPDCPHDLSSYTLEIRPTDSPGEWVELAHGAAPVDDDVLALWDTCGWSPGNYDTRLTVAWSFPDPLVIDAGAQLVRELGVGCGVGDLNCDGARDYFDIEAFLLALQSEAVYYAVYPECNWTDADCNGDGAVGYGDIGGFLAMLGG